jgi:hypothetical protein
MDTTPSAVGKKRILWGRQINWGRVTLVVLAVLVLYTAVDLFWPFHRNLRQFDPKSTAKLEAKMWRSYYANESTELFLQVAELLRAQFGFPLLRSYRAAYFAARAALIFKDGRNRNDYVQALPALQSYFGAIKRIGTIGFNVQRVARAELEWWIVHRERDRNPPGALQRTCAEVAAAMYQVSPDSTMEYGRLRAAAMIIRDARSAAGTVSEKDWMLIESLLQGSYESLQRVVNRSTGGGS